MFITLIKEPYVLRMIYYKTLLLCSSVLFILRDAKTTSNVTLQPSFFYVFEEEFVNLTCAFHKSANYQIILSNPTYGIVDYSNQTHECNTSGALFQSAVVYRVYCNDTAVTVTIQFLKNTIQQHWTCLNRISAQIAYSDVVFGARTVNVNLTAKGGTNTGTISLQENSTLDLQCTSSYSRPNADIKLYGYNDSNIHVEINDLFMITTYENNTVGLSKTISNVSFNTARFMDKWHLYCKANNSVNGDVKSNEVALDVLYPPTQSPVITTFGNGTTYFVIENSTAELVCSIDKSNPLSNLSWSCGNGETTNNNSAMKELSRVLLWKARRSTKYPCVCQSSYKNIVKTAMVIVDVLYPPENVTINSTSQVNTPQQNFISVIENNEINISCSAISNPAPDNISWSGIYTSVSRELMILSNRNITGNLTCSVSNTMAEPQKNKITFGNISKTYVLDVLYPPSIQTLSNISILENNSLTVVCKINLGNPSQLLNIIWINTSYSTFGNASVLDIKNVNKKDTGWRTCEVNYTMVPTFGDMYNGTDSRHFYLDVLYPPENITINSTTEPNHNASGRIRMIENTSLTLFCYAEGNPRPSYSWSGINVSDTFTVNIYSSKTSNGNITCSVSNMMNATSNNTSIVGKASKTLFVDILYPPSIQHLSNISVIENNSLSVVCKINQENFSQLKHIRWINTSYSAFGNEISLEIENVNKRDNGWHTCEVNYNMLPTFGDTYKGNVSRKFYLDVLYPPENININSTTEPNYNASERIRMIEHTSLTLFCYAEGNPRPSYSWSGINASDTSTVNIYSSKTSNRNITCLVSNMMNATSNNTSIVGKASKTLFVEILYSPVIFNQTNATAVEGEDFNISCVVRRGQVSTQSTLWFGHQIDSTKTDSLMIHNITRQHAGNLTCNTSYSMIPTYGDPKYEVITKHIVLDVFYKATVSNFSVDSNEQNTSVTVNENSNVRMVCIVDSNPYSTVNISKGNKTVALKNRTHILEYNIRKSSCNDAGIYECSGLNFLNQHMASLSRKLRLFVNCLPRPSSPADVQQNITISQHSSANFTFMVMAYPPPHFDWFRVEDTKLTKAENGYINMKNISEYEMQISFLVTRVNESDFGEYLLKVNNTFGEYRQSFFLLKTENHFDEQNTPDDSIAGPVAGGVIGSILGILAIAAAVFLIRKRELLKKSLDGEKRHEYQNVDFSEVPESKQNKRLPPLPPPEEESEVHVENQTQNKQDFDKDYPTDDHPYLNTLELIELIRKVNLSDLFSYVTSKTSEDFLEEFEKFPQGLMASIPYNFARKPENAPLNRYQGIYPYDHSRVAILGQPDFFINANYIDGYLKGRAFIASLGPTARHTLGFTTFWNMVWHERSDVIVMLTNLQEPSGMKCEKYWAENGTTRTIGDFTIQSIGEDVAAEYTVRTFTVFRNQESRLVTQLHYTAWPDKKVPEDVTSLIELRQRVKATPTRSLGPLIVHCSAGIGRTGTYIALERLIEEGKITNSVKVFDCVMNMRKQRVNMVQTLDQYIYLHQALVYCLVFDTEPITTDEIDEYIQTTSNNVYSKLFQQLQQTVEVEAKEEIEAREQNGELFEMNRRKADIPGNTHRIRLFIDKEMDESDYINAVYLNGFKRLDHFILAQSPLPKTLNDFVAMLYQENCCCIVALDDYLQHATNNASYLPPENQTVTYGNFTISGTKLDSKPAYSVRKLKMGHSGQFDKGEKVAYHFEFTGWKHDESIPKDPKLFVDFVKDVDEYSTHLADNHSHVLVHCVTGSERSGLFCAVSNIIEKMGQERHISIVNTLRQVRARRKTAIPDMEQLKFCYHAVNAFVKNYKI